MKQARYYFLLSAIIFQATPVRPMQEKQWATKSLQEKLYYVNSILERFEKIFPYVHSNQVKPTSECLSQGEKQPAGFMAYGNTFGINYSPTISRYLVSIKRYLEENKPKSILLLGAGAGSATLLIIIDTIKNSYPKDTKVRIGYNDAIDHNYGTFLKRLRSVDKQYGEKPEIEVSTHIGDAFNADNINQWDHFQYVLEENTLHFLSQLSQKVILSETEERVGKSAPLYKAILEYQKQNNQENSVINLLQYKNTQRITLFSSTLLSSPRTYLIPGNYKIKTQTIYETKTLKYSEVLNKLLQQKTIEAMLDLTDKIDYSKIIPSDASLLPQNFFSKKLVDKMKQEGYQQVRIHILAENFEAESHMPAFFKDVDLSTETNTQAIVEKLSENPLKIMIQTFNGNMEEIKEFLRQFQYGLVVASIAIHINR